MGRVKRTPSTPDIAQDPSSPRGGAPKPQRTECGICAHFVTLEEEEYITGRCSKCKDLPFHTTCVIEHLECSMRREFKAGGFSHKAWTAVLSKIKSRPQQMMAHNGRAQKLQQACPSCKDGVMESAEVVKPVRKLTPPPQTPAPRQPRTQQATPVPAKQKPAAKQKPSTSPPAVAASKRAPTPLPLALPAARRPAGVPPPPAPRQQQQAPPAKPAVAARQPSTGTASPAKPASTNPFPLLDPTPSDSTFAQEQELQEREAREAELRAQQEREAQRERAAQLKRQREREQERERQAARATEGLPSLEAALVLPGGAPDLAEGHKLRLCTALLVSMGFDETQAAAAAAAAHGAAQVAAALLLEGLAPAAATIPAATSVGTPKEQAGQAAGGWEPDGTQQHTAASGDVGTAGCQAHDGLPTSAAAPDWSLAAGMPGSCAEVEAEVSWLPPQMDRPPAEEGEVEELLLLLGLGASG